MMDKNSVEVVINNKIYSLSGAESPEYLQKLARYIDMKTRDLASENGYRKMSAEYQNLFLALNLADDYFKCRDELEMMDLEAAKREKELYEIKHEMIDSKIQAESLSKMVTEYKNLVQQLQKEVIRLEQRKGDDE